MPHRKQPSLRRVYGKKRFQTHLWMEFLEPRNLMAVDLSWIDSECPLPSTDHPASSTTSVFVGVSFSSADARSMFDVSPEAQSTASAFQPEGEGDFEDESTPSDDSGVPSDDDSDVGDEPSEDDSEEDPEGDEDGAEDPEDEGDLDNEEGPQGPLPGGGNSGGSGSEPPSSGDPSGDNSGNGSPQGTKIHPMMMLPMAMANQPIKISMVPMKTSPHLVTIQ